MRCLIIFLSCLRAAACAGNIDQHATIETKNLFRHMKALASSSSKVMWGHHEDTWYGAAGGHSPYHVQKHDGHFNAFEFTINQVYSNSPDELSDTKAVTGHYPAVLGMDFGDASDNRLKMIQYLGKKAHARGQIITISYHMNNPISGGQPWVKDDKGDVYHTVKRLLPGGDHNWKYKQMLDKVVNFAFTFKDDNGNQIPFILRLFHEQNGNWFWWGLNNKVQNSEQDLRDIFKYTVTYIRDTKNVHNILYAISPDKFNLYSQNDYLKVYPGDDYVDVIGLDYYYNTPSSPSTSDFKQKVDWIVDIAESRGKIPALTETGVQNNGIDQSHNFWKDHILDILKSDHKAGRIAYMLSWATLCGNGHCQTWFPYKGHPAEADFRNNFARDSMVYFVNQIGGFYN